MIRLSEDEAWDVLDKSHTGILTTLRRDGTPVSLPVWYVCDERTIVIRTPPRTKKVARVKRDARAAFLVESGERWIDLLGVHLSGAIRIVDDPDDVSRLDATIEAKYVRPPFNAPASTNVFATGNKVAPTTFATRSLNRSGSQLSGSLTKAGKQFSSSLNQISSSLKKLSDAVNNVTRKLTARSTAGDSTNEE